MERKTKTAQKKPFCTYCDYTGIVHAEHFETLGETPLSPCPKCVETQCTCGGDDPFFIFTDGRIQDCSCRETRMKIRRIMQIYQRSGINRKYEWKYLSHFESVNKQAAAVKAAAYDIVKNYPNIEKGLFIWGNPGTGKTMLGSIILTELITRHAVESRFVSISRDIFKNLQATFVEGSETYGESSKIEKLLAQVPILVIDDFGIQKDTAWKQETLYDLVDARYEAERFTIFTSNVNPHTALKDLSQGRVLSRIKEMCRIMEVSGDDYRDKL